MTIDDAANRRQGRDLTADDLPAGVRPGRRAAGSVGVGGDDGHDHEGHVPASERAAYERIAEDYLGFVTQGLGDATSVLRLATDRLLEDIGSVAGFAVCDLGCGEGHLARRLAAIGGAVVGVDVSPTLLATARDRTIGENPRFVLDDAQGLTSFGESRFDLVVANLMLMDVADLASVCGAVRRVLHGGGRFVVSITHPCFQAPHADSVVDAEGRFVARRVPRYATEGAWRSTNPSGIRGRVGAHHRTLTSYVNALAAAGFAITHLSEPVLPADHVPSPDAQGRHEIPSVLIIDARRP